MKWPWSKEEKKPLTIKECLDSDRPDINVAEWLQARALGAGADQLPTEVMAAHRADAFLGAINGDGFHGFFTNTPDEIEPARSALTLIGLADAANCIDEALKVLGVTSFPIDPAALERGLDDDDCFDALDPIDERIFAASGEMEEAIHSYIRANLAVFQQYD
jgi:hypothetical protein